MRGGAFASAVTGPSGFSLPKPESGYKFLVSSVLNSS